MTGSKVFLLPTVFSMHRYGPIPSPYWIIRDGDDARIERLKFHIERDDYFPFLATVVGMLSDTITTCNASSDVMKTQSLFAEDLRKDLLYLHEHYAISPRKERLAYTKEKVVRFGTS